MMGSKGGGGGGPPSPLSTQWSSRTAGHPVRRHREQPRAPVGTATPSSPAPPGRPRHPRPPHNPGQPGGALRITSANITSMNSQLDVVIRLPGQVLALQETRMGAAAQRIMTRTLADQGWHIIWGAPMPLISLGPGATPTPWSAHAGGCAIAARAGTPLRALSPTTAAVKQLWEAGRWCHATLPWGTGRSFLHVASLYAPVDDAQAADASIFAALTELAALGEVPILLTGDFNLEAHLSPTLAAACTNGGWHDVAELFARQSGTPAAPTCTARPGAEPRRLDFMLANTVMMSACQAFTILEDTGLPTHKPLSLLLSLQAFARRALRPRRPLAFPTQGAATVDEDAAWRPVALAWETALARPAGPDIDALWALFCAAAEDYLLAQQADHLDRPPKRYLGRASCTPPRMAPVLAPQGRGAQYGALTHQHLRLLKLLRRLEAHHRARTPAPQRPGPLPYNEAHRWTLIYRSAADLLDPELGWAAPLRSSLPPPLDAMPAVLDALRALVTAQYERMRRARSESWTSWVRTTWDSGSPGRLYAYARGETSTPATLLQRPDGSLTADPAEMDELLRAAWGPIFQLYTSSPEPAWEPFEARFGAYIVPNPLPAPPLTAVELRKTLRKQSTRTACGPDGWRVAELRALPDLFLGHLATLLTCVEEHGHWPPALCQAWITLIPKGTSPSPLEQRPISVASSVYRLWAATRLRYAVQWQEGWIHPSQHGFRPRHSAVDAFYAMALTIEEALLSNKPLTGALLDYAKCFDRLPHAVLLSLARKSGMDENVLRPLRAIYTDLERRFKVGGGLGLPFKPTNGILQGCPLSVILINLLQAVWTRAVLAETKAVPISYADDAGLNGTRSAVQAGGSLTRVLADLTGQLLNTKKCEAFDTSGDPTPLMFDDKALQMVTATRYLGANLTLSSAA